MKITVKDEKKYRIVTLEGEFSLYNVRELKETLFRNVDSGKLRLVLSMKNVTYMDSSAIGVLYALDKKLNEMGRELLFSGVNTDIQDILNISGIEYKSVNIRQSE